MGDQLSRNLMAEADEDKAQPAPGEVIAGKYRVEKLVGRGGMGVVLSAQHVALGQTVAIKVLSTDALDEVRRREASARFLREGQSAARLTSDHVVRIYDVGTLDSGAPFMVMELLRGEDLASLLERQGPAPVEVAIEYVVQACDAVAEAHATGIVHRDLKPSNLFVSRRSDGRPLVKVLDFGISKAMNPGGDPFEGSLTATRSVVGSPYYMSPEQVRDAKRVDARTDIWSLGMILYELLTGEPAFNADTLPGICAAIAADNPAPVREKRPDVPPEVEAVVSRCLEKDPAKRFQSIPELVKALTPFVPLSPASSALYAARPAVIDSLDRRFAPDAPTIGIASPESGPRRSTDAAAYAATDPPTRLPHTLASAARAEASAAAGDAREVPSATRAPKEKGDTAVATLVSSSGSTMTAARSSRTRRLVLSAIAASVLVIAAFVGVLLRKSPSPPLETETVKTPDGADHFTLTIESVPPGANVLDGDRIVGVTPFTTVIENASVKTSARRLVLRLDGYEPYEVEQGRSETPVRVSAALVRVQQGARATEAEAPTVISRPPPKTLERSKAAPKPPAHKAAPATTAVAPADIRLER